MTNNEMLLATSGDDTLNPFEHKLLDEIREHRATIRNLETSLKAAEEELERVKWISVEDRLPKKYEKVFIYPRPEYQDICYTGHTNGEHWFVDEYDSQYSDTHEVNVTHWMPLLEPQKEGIDK